MENNNTTVTGNVTSAENKAMELKINFTDNELQSIAINAMGRSSEAGKQATTNIYNFIKLFLVFFCSMSFAYGEKMEGYNYADFSPYDDFYDTGNYPLPEYLSNPKYLHQVYQELDSRLNQAYKNIMNSTIYPQANKTALKNSQIAWIKAKEAECKKFSKNKDKLTNCYLDKTIDKINELWEIEASVIEKPFEGKWIFVSNDHGYDRVGTMLVQRGNNVCGTSTDWATNKRYTVMALWKANKPNNSIKACDMFRNRHYLVNCETDNGADLPFKDWQNDSVGYVSSTQGISKSGFGYVKIPFTQDELDKLSKTQWLQDCLNYKGE